ncbi:MAG: D-aminoacyl-tRNA deacylase [Phycisphaerales bacterium JB038]
MKAVVQRVTAANVEVNDQIVGAIEAGLCVLLALEEGDGDSQAAWMAEKLANLRIFEDEAGHMNRSLLDTGGAMLLVPNFTVAGNCRKGRRPSFDKAMHPSAASPGFDAMADRLRGKGLRVETGVFGAHMHVSLLNDGPVTLILDTAVRRSDAPGG